MERSPKGTRSKNPYILFELSKVEPALDWDWSEDEEDWEDIILKPSKLTEEERADFSSICHFQPDYYPHALEDGELPDDLVLESYEILYNSIKHGDGSFEFDVEDDKIRGSAVLIVRFNLNKTVNVHTFYRTVEQSRVKVIPSESGGWTYEDHNGWSRPIRQRDMNELAIELDLPRRGTPVPWED